MALPARVQEQARRAEELSRGRQSAPAAPAPAAPAPAAPEGDLVAKLAAADAEVKRLTAANVVLQGKYNTEVPRIAEQLRLAQATLKDLEEKAKKKIDAGELTTVSAEDRTRFGEDLVKMVAHAATEVAERVVDSRIAPLTKRLDDSQKMSEGQYLATLDDLVPGWKQQNEDPKFVAWLGQLDPTTQRLRNDRLQSADAMMQGLRTAEIFLAFQEGREIGVRTPAPDPLERRLEPGDGLNREVALNEGDKKVWTKAAIAEFYRDIRLGKYKAPDKIQERRAIEADLLAASRENRVTA